MINNFLVQNYEEVFFDDFYRELFPVGSFEEKGVFIDGKYNGIAVSIGAGDKKVRRYTITDDLDLINELVSGDDFCLMSPISYIGKSRKSQNARQLYAMAIDVDGIKGENGMRFFLHQVEEGHEMRKGVWGLPKPTYLVSSGTGIHVYYVFKQPIDLFPSVIEPLEKLRRRLTWQAWTQGAIDKHHRENVQYESLFQGFRMVGSITKVGTRVRAFRVGDKVDIDYLNFFVPDEYAVSSQDLVYKSKLSLAAAKEKYPEWYDKRIIQNEPKGAWQCNRALYDWWKKRLPGEIKEGHRYWGVMTLATYAVKCGIPYEELEKDAFELRPILSKKGAALTEDDVMHALEAYNDSYVTYPIDTIVERTGLKIEKNKRNFRKQKEHIKIMNFVRDEIAFPNGNWRNKNGAPTKQMMVKKWRQNNPLGKKIDCERETGLSRKTILKWWDS